MYEETDAQGGTILNPITRGLIPLWDQMYKHTNFQCDGCKSPCCNEEYCEVAREYANSLGIYPWETTNELFYQADDGKCICPPHLRPICTIHHCRLDSSTLSEEWLEKYWEMRDELNIKLWENRVLR